MKLMSKAMCARCGKVVGANRQCGECWQSIHLLLFASDFTDNY